MYYHAKVFVPNNALGGGFKHFLFSPLFGEDSHFDGSHIFQMGWLVQPPTSAPNFILRQRFWRTGMCGVWW